MAFCPTKSLKQVGRYFKARAIELIYILNTSLDIKKL
ncbi:hypothetical protein HH_1078 [Helicobacter hepaticus ATCC 51449]|uniref:Uncharacterized protein n=1 Tax=Helicobacter hepaticus (strain ATCC 51449 / 3B1) TaxID=235279 RepID=Q7VH89_HELHP|nr:hypothetical protein HH_1078 [Helicobacter hepaticus ATCC 51449]